MRKSRTPKTPNLNNTKMIYPWSHLRVLKCTTIYTYTWYNTYMSKFILTYIIHDKKCISYLHSTTSHGKIQCCCNKNPTNGLCYHKAPMTWPPDSSPNLLPCKGTKGIGSWKWPGLMVLKSGFFPHQLRWRYSLSTTIYKGFFQKHSSLVVGRFQNHQQYLPKPDFFEGPFANFWGCVWNFQTNSTGKIFWNQVMKALRPFLREQRLVNDSLFWDDHEENSSTNKTT